MAQKTVTRRRLALLAVLFLIANAAVDFGPGRHSMAASYVFQVMAPILAMSACWWRVGAGPRRTRRLWILLALGLSLWTLGTLLSAWEDLFQHFPFEIASLADFAYFFYGVPILFALSTPLEEERFRLFTWLDAIQAIFAGYLAYVTIFAAAPFSKGPAEPISVSLLVLTYHLENAALLAGCVLRLLSTPKGGGERRFYGILCAFLATYGLGGGVYNQLAMASPTHLAPDVIANAPFLLLAYLILRHPVSAVKAEEVAAKKSRLVQSVDLASPVFFTLALLALGFIVLRNHFTTGIVAIAVALAVYGVRTTILQIRFRHAQEALQVARDRLEEISLQDGLTGIANRRNFDRTLDSEWHRALRTNNTLSLLLIDLDFFKHVNDEHGHPYGDRCLVEVALTLQSVASRSGDLVARYGGEEFAVILPATTQDAAVSVAEKMREAVLLLRIPNETGLGAFVSVSVGVSTVYAPQQSAPAILLEAADKALYKAKQLGRNRTELGHLQIPAPP